MHDWLLWLDTENSLLQGGQSAIDVQPTEVGSYIGCTGHTCHPSRPLTSHLLLGGYGPSVRSLHATQPPPSNGAIKLGIVEPFPSPSHPFCLVLSLHCEDNEAHRAI